MSDEFTETDCYSRGATGFYLKVTCRCAATQPGAASMLLLIGRSTRSIGSLSANDLTIVTSSHS